MPGIANDQVAIYLKDMYKAEREGYKEMPEKHSSIYKVVGGATGAGECGRICTA